MAHGKKKRGFRADEWIYVNLGAGRSDRRDDFVNPSDDVALNADRKVLDLAGERPLQPA